MARLNADLSNFETVDLDLSAAIPPGDYEVEITGSRLKQGETGPASSQPRPGRLSSRSFGVFAPSRRKDTGSVAVAKPRIPARVVSYVVAFKLRLDHRGRLGFSPSPPTGERGGVRGRDQCVSYLERNFVPGPAPLRSAQFEFVVIGPYCRGAKLWDSFTLEEGPSLRRLRTLVVAAGFHDPNFIRDTEDLHGLRCRVRVDRVGERGAFGSKNIIARYLVLEKASLPIIK